MALMIDVSITNMGSFQRDMQRAYEKMHRKELLKVIRPAATIMMKAVKARTPQRTGFMYRSIKLKAQRGKSDYPFANYFVDFANIKKKSSGKKEKAFYGIMVHNGTIVVPGEKRKHRSRTEAEDQRRLQAGGYEKIKPNPWVYEAFEATAQQVSNKLLEDVWNKL